MHVCKWCKSEFNRPGTGPKKYCSDGCWKLAKKERQKSYQVYCRKCRNPISSGAVCDSCKLPRTLLSFDESKGDRGKKACLLREQSHRHCEMVDCFQTHWKDQPIPLELDHIDGNPEHNSRSNLRLICPNCHSMLPTHRGRNIGRSGVTRRSLKMKKYGSYRLPT